MEVLTRSTVSANTLCHGQAVYGIPDCGPDESGMDPDDEEDEECIHGQENAREMMNEVVIRSGFLQKRKEQHKRWKRRWFVLRASRLAYYKNEKEYQLLHVIHANDIRAVVPVELKRIGLVIGIVTHEQTLYIQGATPAETYEWATAIERISTNSELLRSPIRIPRSPTLSEPCTSSGAVAASWSPRSLRDERRRGSLPSQIYIGTQGDILPSFDLRMDEVDRNRLAAPSTLLSSSEEEGDMEVEEMNDRIMPLRQETPQGQGMRITQEPSSYAAPAQGDSLRPQDLDDPDRVLAQGYLMKQSNLRKLWRKRWFVLTSSALIYSRSHMDRRVHRRIPMSTVLDVMECKPTDTHAASMFPSQSALHLLGFGHDALHGSPASHGSEEHCFKMVTPSRTFLLCAPTEEDLIKWLSALQTLLNRRRNSHLANRLVH